MADFEEFVAEFLIEGRVCPQPKQWDALWKMLPNRVQEGAGWRPALPLILGGWWHSGDDEKRARFIEHIRWAQNHDILNEVADFLRKLGPEDWHKENATNG